ncbi:MAG: BolA/IbaG family iron-sulfur metabolism protein [Pseudomonadota bacterium]
MSALIEETIEQKLKSTYQPIYLYIENESHMHRGGANLETHFKVILVSEAFKNSNLLSRHRMVYATLVDEMKQIHALAVHAFTIEEWAMRQDDSQFASPKCRGGEKKS